MTPLESIAEMNNLVADINAILARQGVTQAIDLSDIIVTENTVSDLVKPDAKLSAAITDFLWLNFKEAYVYHYTSRSAAESILCSGIFRLTSIKKRLTDGEIQTFCETHNLTGYLQNKC